MPLSLLLAGASTRAAAESAARAGFDVTAVDAFGDLDQHRAVDAIRIQPFSPRAAARGARDLPCGAVAYLSSFENHPSAVATLAAGRALWGNSPAVLRRVRNPRLVHAALHQRGLAAPRVFGDRESTTQRTERTEKSHLGELGDLGGELGWPTRLLVKPLASGGGHRVRLWDRDAPVPSRCYLQEFVDGTPGSVVFVAAGGRAVPLGISRQLIGETAFGSMGYRYCGNILAPAGDGQFARDDELAGQACALARGVADAFGLVGVNGVDFVARAGVPYAIEVNPRWSASMELVERAYGLSLFGAHAAACSRGALPDFDLLRTRRGARAVGKAIVFAPRDLVVGNSRLWLTDPNVRDVPRPGERLRVGTPVCTVFAEGPDSGACYAALASHAEDVYAQLETWARSVA